MKPFMSIYCVLFPNVFTEKVIEIQVLVSEYIAHLVDQCACVVTLTGVVKEAKQHFLEREDIVLTKPKLQLTVFLNTTVMMLKKQTPKLINTIYL